MKITKKQLQKIIQEELQQAIAERYAAPPSREEMEARRRADMQARMDLAAGGQLGYTPELDYTPSGMPVPIASRVDPTIEHTGTPGTEGYIPPEQREFVFGTGDPYEYGYDPTGELPEEGFLPESLLRLIEQEVSNPNWGELPGPLGIARTTVRRPPPEEPEDPLVGGFSGESLPRDEPLYSDVDASIGRPSPPDRPQGRSAGSLRRQARRNEIQALVDRGVIQLDHGQSVRQWNRANRGADLDRVWFRARMGLGRGGVDGPVFGSDEPRPLSENSSEAFINNTVEAILAKLLK